jgi:hypothetical protein
LVANLFVCLFPYLIFQKDTIAELEKKIKQQLSIYTTADGKKIGLSIEHVINRELNWIQWKKSGCLPFGKSPEPADEVFVSQLKRFLIF